MYNILQESFIFHSIFEVELYNFIQCDFLLHRYKHSPFRETKNDHYDSIHAPNSKKFCHTIHLDTIEET